MQYILTPYNSKKEGGGSPLDNKTCCDTISGQHVDMKYRTIECCTPWVLPTEVLLIAYKKYIPGPQDLKVHIDILMGYIYVPIFVH